MNQRDRDVDQIVRTLENRQDQLVGKQLLSVETVYDAIKRSNSSLARKKKHLLYESIERVLVTRKAKKERELEGSSDDNSVSNLQQHDAKAQKEELPQEVQQPTSKHLQNQTLLFTQQNMSSTTPQDQEGTPSKKRRRDIGTGTKTQTHTSRDYEPPVGPELMDIAGWEAFSSKLHDHIFFPLIDQEMFRLRPVTGVLIHGPAGTGKTMVATAIAARLKLTFISISAESLISGVIGESEKNMRRLFDKALSLAPCTVLIEGLDNIFGKGEPELRDMERRMSSIMHDGFERLARNMPDGKHVTIIATARTLQHFGSEIRSTRHYKLHIPLTMPGAAVREEILRTLSKQYTTAADIDFNTIAKKSPGFAGHDLDDVFCNAGVIAKRNWHTRLYREWQRQQPIAQNTAWCKLLLDDCVNEFVRTRPHDYALLRAQYPFTGITTPDMVRAIGTVTPIATSDGISTVPSTTWGDVGAMDSVRDILKHTITWRLDNPDIAESAGLTAPAGILLWGPPGCGKTLVAMAVANDANANFIHVKGPELLNKFVGESEKAVRRIFERARMSAPCIIFFDEFDALAPHRGGTFSSNGAIERVVNTLLVELDCTGGGRKGIDVICATNRPDTIDVALLRHGRIGKKIFVGLPTPSDRVIILEHIFRSNRRNAGEDRMAEEVREVKRVANDQRCTRFSGADLAGLFNVAANNASKAAISGRTPFTFEPADWEAALDVMQPSITEQQLSDYMALVDKH